MHDVGFVRPKKPAKRPKRMEIRKNADFPIEINIDPLDSGVLVSVGRYTLPHHGHLKIIRHSAQGVTKVPRHNVRRRNDSDDHWF
jgi:hypothetical protein